MSFRQKLNAIQERHAVLSLELQSPDLQPKQMAELSKEYSDLSGICDGDLEQEI